MNVKFLEELSNAFGPSGFEEDVVRIIKNHTEEFHVESDAMHNVYVHRKDVDVEVKPRIQLDSHLDECGFMVQNIQDNGTLGILTLGGFQMTNLPAHSVWIRTRSGQLVRGVIIAKPPHFMTEEEKANQKLTIETMYVDVGTTSREETEDSFGISIGDPIIPDVTFSYDEKHGVFFGKAFDNRAGSLCVVETMKNLHHEKDLAVEPVGALAAQEEVGMRGAQVTSQVIKPTLAIVFEGSPSDDFFVASGQAQGRMKGGAQLRLIDKSYISNPRFIRFAEKVAQREGIKIQIAVRRGGSTNASRISLSHTAVPVLVIGVPSRYVHSHYNYCAKEDIESAIALATALIKELTPAAIDEIYGKNL